MMKQSRYVVLILLLFLMVTAMSAAAKETKQEKQDVLYARKITELELLAIIKYDDLSIGVFRDKITDVKHPVQAGDKIAGGKIRSIGFEGIRIERKKSPDVQFTLEKRVVENKSTEYVTFERENMDIRGLLANLARPAGIPILVDNRMKMKLSMKVKDLHWRDILDIVVSTFGLHMVEGETEIKIFLHPPGTGNAAKSE